VGKSVCYSTSSIQWWIPLRPKSNTHQDYKSK
jgi:hypothetical protein